MDEVDGAIAQLTCAFGKTELFERLIAARVPCAPVRTLSEVVDDPHLHERKSLQWIDHPEYGRMVVNGSPLRFAGDDPSARYRPSQPLGADTESILVERLALSTADIRELHRQQVV